MIIDAHVHLPVPPSGKDYARSRADLLRQMEAGGVDRVLLIPDHIPGSAIGDMETCLALLAADRQVFMLGVVDVLKEHQAVLARLDQLLGERRIFGIKIFPGHDPIYPTDERLTPVYDLCRKHCRPVMIHTGWNSGDPSVARFNDPKHIVEVARAMPDLAIVISHYFWPAVEYCCELTLGVPNIAYDTSALADAEVVRETGAERIRDVLLRTIQSKPRGVILGSDYGMCSMPGHLELIRSLGLAREQLEQVLWRNARDLFHLPVEGNAQQEVPGR